MSPPSVFDTAGSRPAARLEKTGMSPYSTLHAAVAPLYSSFGMDIGAPEEAGDYLAITDMVAFGLVANWLLRLLDESDDEAPDVLARLGPFGSVVFGEIEAGYKKWLIQSIHALDEPVLLREVVRLGISATSWSQWQAEEAGLPVTQEFLDDCVQTVVKMAWFKLTEEGDPAAYLAAVTPARLIESLHEAMREQGSELGIPVL
jgi:hypothetical protein